MPIRTHPFLSTPGADKSLYPKKGAPRDPLLRRHRFSIYADTADGGGSLAPTIRDGATVPLLTFGGGDPEVSSGKLLILLAQLGGIGTTTAQALKRLDFSLATDLL